MTDWSNFVPELNKKNICLVPWCNEMPCEEEIKKKSGEEGKKLADQSETALSGAAKSLCIPFEQDELPASCVVTFLCLYSRIS